MGQVIAREETSVSGQTGAPHEIWYRYGGRELGYTGNNGTSDMAMSASISERQKVTPTNQGTFRNKQLAGTAYADFAQAYDPLNSYNQGSSSGSYTVQMGDTLQSIAQGLYGDSGLWYKIAEVNGLSAYSGLIEGQRLTLPAGVMNATHNASSFKAYDPSSTLGDVNPSTNPTPQKAKKGCGVFGTILLAVVAIAVTAVIKVPVAKFFAGLGSSIAGATGAAIGTAVGYAATGAAASMVSQSVGLATGIQDKFSWKAVGSAAVRSLFAPQSSGSFATDVINGVVNEAMYQGVATGIGLQNKFDWAGVAAAGISSGVGGQVRSGFGAAANDVAGLAQTVAVGAAEAISYAATRSALTGENFGRNIEAALPNVIASALVNGASLALRSIGNSGAAQIEADAPTSENQATTGEQVSGAIINISGARNGGLGDYSVALGGSSGVGQLLQSSSLASSEFGAWGTLGNDNGLLRRTLTSAQPETGIASGQTATRLVTASDEIQARFQIKFFADFARGTINGPDIAVFASELLFEQTGKEHIVQSSEWQAYIDQYSDIVASGHRPEAPYLRSQETYELRLDQRIRGAFLNTSVGAFGLHYANGMALGIPSLTHGEAFTITAKNNPEAAFAGEATSFVAGFYGGGTIVKAGSRTISSKSATPIMRGLAFENIGVTAAQAQAFLPSQSIRRLSVRAFNDSGKLLPGRTVLDAAGYRANDVFGALEFKLHNGVSLTTRQAEHFPALAKNGGIVVGKKGEDLGLRAGDPIAPFDVQRINGPDLPQTWWPQ